MQNIISFINNYKVPIFEGKKIINYISLSSAFGSFCNKIVFDDSSKFVIKGIFKQKKKIIIPFFMRENQ